MNLYLIEITAYPARNPSGLLVAARDSKQCRKIAVEYATKNPVGTIAAFTNSIGSSVRKIGTASSSIKEAAVVSVLR